MNTIRNKWNKYNKNTIYNTNIKIMQLKKIDIYNWKKIKHRTFEIPW